MVYCCAYMIAEKCFTNAWVVGVGREMPQATEITIEKSIHALALLERLAPSHLLRAALQKLHTLEPIRIIEGKGSAMTSPMNGTNHWNSRRRSDTLPAPIVEGRKR